MTRRRRALAAGAGLATSATLSMLARRGRRITAFPPGPDAITPEMARDRAAELLERPSLRRRDLAMDFAPAIVDVGRPAASRPALLPAHARGHRGRDRPCPPAHLRLQARRDRDDVPRGARGQGRARASRSGSRSTRSAARSTSAARRSSRTCWRPASRSWPHDGIMVVREGPLGARRPGTAPRGHPPLRPPQDGRHRRPGRLRRRQRHRGPLQRRALLRRHVPGHRADRRASSSWSSWPAGATTAGPLRPTRRPRPLVPAGHARGPGRRGPARRRRRSSGTCPGPGTTRSATPSRRPSRTPSGGSTSSTRTSATGRSSPGSWRPPSAASRSSSIAPGKPTPPYPAAAFRHHYQRLLDAGCDDPAPPGDGPRQGPLGSTTGCSSAAATSTTCRCSGTTSSTSCSRIPTSSR